MSLDGFTVSVGGGAQTAQQFLRAGLVDKITLSLVPVLLGSGERSFMNLDDELHGLKLVQTIATPEVVHLKFSRP
jgi:dihydrofolate reductase